MNRRRSFLKAILAAFAVLVGRIARTDTSAAGQLKSPPVSPPPFKPVDTRGRDAASVLEGDWLVSTASLEANDKKDRKFLIGRTFHNSKVAAIAFDDTGLLSATIELLGTEGPDFLLQLDCFSASSALIFTEALIIRRKSISYTDFRTRSDDGRPSRWRNPQFKLSDSVRAQLRYVRVAIRKLPAAS
jgi:hypothetical protein